MTDVCPLLDFFLTHNYVAHRSSRIWVATADGSHENAYRTDYGLGYGTAEGMGEGLEGVGYVASYGCGQGERTGEWTDSGFFSERSKRNANPATGWEEPG